MTFGRVTPKEVERLLEKDIEGNGDVKILKGPPIPAVLPSKGIGILVESGKLKCYMLSEMASSDMVVRTPVGFKNGMRFFWNLWRSRAKT